MFKTTLKCWMELMLDFVCKLSIDWSYQKCVHSINLALTGHTKNVYIAKQMRSYGVQLKYTEL